MKEISDPSRPDRPLTTRGPVIRALHQRITRLTRIMLVVLLGGILGTGLMLAAFQREQHRIARLERDGVRAAYEACVDRNRRAEASGAALARLGEAARRDGDTHAERAWQGFVAATGKAPPLPPCRKPPG